MNIKRVYQLVLASSRIPAFSFALPLLEWVSPLAQKNTNNNNFISLLQVNLSRSILWKRRYSFLRSYRLQITAEMDFEISRRNKTFCKMSLNMLKNLIEDITILLSEPNGRTQSTIIFLFCIYLSSINFEIMLEPKYYAITFLWRVHNGLHTETFPSLKNVPFFSFLFYFMLMSTIIIYILRN